VWDEELEEKADALRVLFPENATDHNPSVPPVATGPPPAVNDTMEPSVSLIKTLVLLPVKR
jgi:hypothetical protein